MHPQSAVAVALLAAAPLVSAGNAVIKNACSFPIYAWTVTDYQGEMQTIQSGGEYSQAYQTNSDGGGVSMKIATNPTTAGSITQYEYTLESTLWYDISNINGNPFQQWGLSLVPSMGSCRSVVCEAGVEACSAVYNTPDQNWATAACDPSADTVLTLCSANGNANVGHEHKHHHHHHHKGTSVSNPAPSITSVVDQVSSSITYNNYGAPMTTFVTQVVTITAREAEASPAAAEEQPVRRHMHQHHYHPHGRN